MVYDELRRLAARRLAREKPGQTFQPTALAHEACRQLADCYRHECWKLADSVADEAR